MNCSKKYFEKGIEILLKVEFVMQPAIDNEDPDELKKLKTCVDFKHFFLEQSPETL